MMSEAEIVRQLRSKKIDCYIVKKKMKEKLVRIPVYFLTFDGPELSKHIVAGYTTRTNASYLREVQTGRT